MAAFHIPASFVVPCKLSLRIQGLANTCQNCMFYELLSGVLSHISYCLSQNGMNLSAHNGPLWMYLQKLGCLFPLFGAWWGVTGKQFKLDFLMSVLQNGNICFGNPKKTLTKFDIPKSILQSRGWNILNGIYWFWDPWQGPYRD